MKKIPIFCYALFLLYAVYYKNISKNLLLEALLLISAKKYYRVNWCAMQGKDNISLIWIRNF